MLESRNFSNLLGLLRMFPLLLCEERVLFSIKINIRSTSALNHSFHLSYYIWCTCILRCAKLSSGAVREVLLAANFYCILQNTALCQTNQKLFLSIPFCSPSRGPCAKKNLQRALLHILLLRVARPR